MILQLPDETIHAQTHRVFCALVWIEDVTVLPGGEGMPRTRVVRDGDVHKLSCLSESALLREIRLSAKQLSALPISAPAAVPKNPVNPV